MTSYQGIYDSETLSGGTPDDARPLDDVDYEDCQHCGLMFYLDDTRFCADHEAECEGNFDNDRQVRLETSAYEQLAATYNQRQAQRQAEDWWQ